jgi:flagellar protein FliO/FliZ
MFDGMIWGFVQFIAATVLVAMLAYFVTKKMAGARGGMGRKGGNLSIVDSVNVGGQSLVQIIKAGDKYLVIGVTKEQVTFLSELSEEQIKEYEAPDLKGLTSPFGKVFSRFITPKDEEPGDEENNDE